MSQPSDVYEQENILLIGGPYNNTVLTFPPPGTHIRIPDPVVVDGQQDEQDICYAIVDTGDRYIATYQPRKRDYVRFYSPAFQSDSAAEYMRHFARICEKMSCAGSELGDMNEDMGWDALGWCLLLAASALDGQPIKTKSKMLYRTAELMSLSSSDSDIPLNV